jgi:hypothetical protein
MFRPPFLRTSSEVFKHLYQIVFILSKKHVNSQCPSSLSRGKVKTERSLKDQLLKVCSVLTLTLDKLGHCELTCFLLKMKRI